MSGQKIGRGEESMQFLECQRCHYKGIISNAAFDDRKSVSLLMCAEG
jgi:hypothetical protein